MPSAQDVIKMDNILSVIFLWVLGGATLLHSRQLDNQAGGTFLLQISGMFVLLFALVPINILLADVVISIVFSIIYIPVVLFITYCIMYVDEDNAISAGVDDE